MFGIHSLTIFFTGTPSKDNDETHPDWAPTLHLPKSTALNSIGTALSDLTRSASLESKESTKVSLKVSVDLNRYKSSFDQNYFLHQEQANYKQVETPQIISKTCSSDIILKQEPHQEPMENPLQLCEVDILRVELAQVKSELEAIQSGAFERFHALSFFTNDAKVEYYTGFQSIEKLWMLFRFLEDQMDQHQIDELPLFEQFCLTLIYLRQYLQPKDLAYRFNLTEMKVLVYIDRFLSAFTKFIVPSYIQWSSENPMSSFAKYFCSVHLQCLGFAVY